jgi:hypothetical protein
MRAHLRYYLKYTQADIESMTLMQQAEAYHDILYIRENEAKASGQGRRNQYRSQR